MSEVVIPYSFYGGNLDAFRCKESEVILSGPRDTGKTITFLCKLHLCAYKYPGASIVIARKRQTDVYSTVLVTYRKKILQDGDGVQAFGGEKPQWFDYPTGSRIWVAGLDKPGKVLSSEHDMIYVNQAEETSLQDWEHLTTTTTGRAGHMPYSQTIGDCNPETPSHWIKQRQRSGANPEGSLTVFESSHRDNPEIYDQETGELTEMGRKRLAPLRALTGARRLRMFSGIWAAPEGAIYSVFEGVDAEGGHGRHVVDHFEIPSTWPRFVGIDPAGDQVAALWLAMDPQTGILNAYREYMQPFGLTVQQHAANILRASAGETVMVWVCGAPAERDWRREWEAAGIPVVAPPIADVWVGIDRVTELLSEFRLVVHDNCRELISEIAGYRRKVRNGVPVDEIEDKAAQHLNDAMRYVVAWLLQPREGVQVVHAPVRVGSW